MPALPTLGQALFFYAAVVMFVVFWAGLLAAWLIVNVLPAKAPPRQAAARIGADARHPA